MLKIDYFHHITMSLESEYARWQMVSKWRQTIFADTEKRLEYEKLAILDRFLIEFANVNTHPEIDPIFGELCTRGKLANDDPLTVKLKLFMKECGDKGFNGKDMLRVMLIDIKNLAATKSSSSSSSEPNTNTKSVEYKNFHAKTPFSGYNARDLCKMCLRYASFPMRGAFLAVPATIYNYLSSHGGIILEGFTAPLNSQLLMNGLGGKFCSMFPDTDSVFGSIGSFFNFDLKDVDLSRQYFVINPPYIEDIILRTISRVRELAKTGKSILLVLPDWKDIIAKIDFGFAKVLPKFSHYYDMLLDNGVSVRKKFTSPFGTTVVMIGKEEDFRAVLKLFCNV
jgi:hypothetical protein